MLVTMEMPARSPLGKASSFVLVEHKQYIGYSGGAIQ